MQVDQSSAVSGRTLEADYSDHFHHVIGGGKVQTGSRWIELDRDGSKCFVDTCNTRTQDDHG